MTIGHDRYPEFNQTTLPFIAEFRVWGFLVGDRLQPDKPKSIR
ncbi:MAG: hypothetical protein ACM37W_03965 [Actinomycetota bacterium]